MKCILLSVNMSAAPSTLTLPPFELITDFANCHEPVKKVFTAEDIPAWLESEAYARLMTVLVRCNLAIKGKQVDRGDSRVQSEVSLRQFRCHRLGLMQESDNEACRKSPRPAGSLDRRASIAYWTSEIREQSIQRLGRAIGAGAVGLSVTHLLNLMFLLRFTASQDTT